MELLNPLENSFNIQVHSDREIEDRDIELTGFLNDAEQFVVEGVTETFSSTDHAPDKDYLVKNPRKFVKPLTLSQLSKVMKKNPDYFKKFQ
jgi:predicted transcriptional regulator